MFYVSKSWTNDSIYISWQLYSRINVTSEARVSSKHRTLFQYHILSRFSDWGETWKMKWRACVPGKCLSKSYSLTHYLDFPWPLGFLVFTRVRRIDSPWLRPFDKDNSLSSSTQHHHNTPKARCIMRKTTCEFWISAVRMKNRPPQSWICFTGWDLAKRRDIFFALTAIF